MKTLEQVEAKDIFKDVIDDWRIYWMNQSQNSQADYDNYYRRAFGVDANMQHHLARKCTEVIALLPAEALIAHPDVKEMKEAFQKLIKTVPYNTIEPDYLVEAKEALKPFAGKEEDEAISIFYSLLLG